MFCPVYGADTELFCSSIYVEDIGQSQLCFVQADISDRHGIEQWYKVRSLSHRAHSFGPGQGRSGAANAWPVRIYAVRKRTISSSRPSMSASTWSARKA